MFQLPTDWRSWEALISGHTILLAQAETEKGTSDAGPASASDVAGDAAANAPQGDAAGALEGAGNLQGAENVVEPGFLQTFFGNPINLILLSAILFMFIVVRPQQRQQKELKQSLANLKKNDRVVTASGIHGTVVQLAGESAETVTIRIDDNSGARMTVNRETIARIVTPENPQAGSK